MVDYNLNAPEIRRRLQEAPEEDSCLPYAKKVMGDSLFAGFGIGAVYGTWTALRWFFCDSLWN